MSEMDEKYTLMTESPVTWLVCRLAVPSIMIMLITALYNMADTYFVGSLGTSATAGVGIAFALMSVIQAVGFFFGHGSGNYISRQLGAQNYDAAERMASTGFFSVLLGGAVITVLGTIFLRPLAIVMGATDTILPYACDYLRYILIGAPFISSSFMLNNLMRFQGSSFYGMIGITSGAILNIALDPLLIFVFGMGVSGAGLATMISQFVSFCLLLFCCTLKGNIGIRFKNFSPSRHAYKEVFRGGLPSLCMQGLAAISTIFLNQVAGNFGDAAIAAMSIVQRVTMMGASALIGFGQGFQPVCGFNYGAKRYDRVRTAFWFCFKTSLAALCMLAVAGYVFAPQILSLFRKDDMEVIRIGAYALQLRCFTFPLLGWVVLVNMMLQTIGKTIPASILALARQGLFLLPFLFILTPFMGIFGVQVCQPAADLVTLAVAVPLGIKTLREMNQKKEACDPADTAQFVR